MQRALQWWTDLFVVWVVLFSAWAFFAPDLFTPLRPLIVPGLGIIMFGMGMTLVPEDFLRVVKVKRAVLCGIVGQFLIMPLSAFALVKIAGVEPDIAMGFIILGACPGGTASNVIAFLARADVALSVTMTACSTLLAPVLTPVLVKVLGGQFLPVDAGAMFLNVVTIVLLPVCVGIGLRYVAGERARPALRVFPALSVLVIVLIIATIMALSKDKLPEVIGVIGVLVFAHNALGLGLGYGLATAFRLPVPARRTVAIEVGMQNSGLGVSLAIAHFAGSPLVALPSSLFSVVHNLTGSVAATIWSASARRPKHAAQEWPDSPIT